MVGIHCEILTDSMKIVTKLKEESQKAMALTMRDMRREIPRVIANVVSAKMNIKKTEALPPYQRIQVNKATGAKKMKRKAVRISVQGETLDTLSLLYIGRRLTVSRFSMTPRKPARFTGRKGHKTRAPVSITASVIRGERKQIERENRRVFVQNVRGVMQAAYAWKGTRNIQGIAKDMSIPQMLQLYDLQPVMQKDIGEAVLKALKKNYNK